MNPTQHVRTYTPRRDRRIAAQFRDKTPQTTLCGAAVTSMDMTREEARKNPDWPSLCPDCKRLADTRKILERHEVLPGIISTDTEDLLRDLTNPLTHPHP